MVIIVYMQHLNDYMDQCLIQGKAHFTQTAAQADLGLSAEQVARRATRLIHQQRLFSPKQGFYVIVRPEARPVPDPVTWIDPLMRHLDLNYRIGLLRAAAFHGAAHQSAMVFHVMVPVQMRPIIAGRYRVQFIYQVPNAFEAVNQSPWLSQLKSDTGYAQVAGCELTLLDAVRYPLPAGGVQAMAQLVHDLGDQCDSDRLRGAAPIYENTVVRRLGYLLERYGHAAQAKALLPYVPPSAPYKPLNPAEKPVSTYLPQAVEKDSTWRLAINADVAIDS